MNSGIGASPPVTWICPASRDLPAGTSSRQNATRFIWSEPSVITTSLSVSSPKPINVGVDPVPVPNFTDGGCRPVS